MKKTQTALGKILYGFLFLGILPTMLWFWAYYTEDIVRYPSIEAPIWGTVLSVLGTLLMVYGMFALMKYGKGLPMNLYPPKKLVAQGPYRLIKHPIYWGFGILLVGISILIESASALWLVTPVTLLGMIALVWGHEKIDLERRFPNEKIKPLLDIGGRELATVRFGDRLSSLFWVFSLMLLGNYVVGYLEGGILPLFGSSWIIHPIFDGTSFYLISLLFVFAVPLVLNRQDRLNEWTISMLIAIAFSIYISLLWPPVGTQYLVTEILPESTASAFSLLVMSIPIFLILLSLRAYAQRFRRFATFFYLAAIFLGIYQLVNSRSSILHLAVGLIIFIIAAYYSNIWFFLKKHTEKVANSWKEWTFGPIRIINHGLYVGFGAFFGILLAGYLVGNGYAWAILVFAMVVTVFSALWAQLIEGSEKLKRPFGYYGALVGILFAGLIVWIMGYNVWIIIGVISVGMPWVQGIGRLRCLINGCCHGRPTKEAKIGIRYFHPRSRVCNLSELKGELLHPTPLYAILWLFFLGFLLLVLWNKLLPYSFIFGLYLILTGIGRFVEEAFRGEVQTPNLRGLHLYQWTAIASVLIGIIMTVIPAKAIEILPDFGWEIISAALIGGLFTFFAMGVDFPRSNARFSRLV